jgi:hypothetical protein
MRSKSVKDEKSSKIGSGGGGPAGSRYSSAKEVRVKQEIPKQAHQLQQEAHNQALEAQLASSTLEQSASTQESPSLELQGISTRSSGTGIIIMSRPVPVVSVGP